MSALFHDADKDLELVTCIDAYLENVFASIPELALCMHSKVAPSSLHRQLQLQHACLT